MFPIPSLVPLLSRYAFEYQRNVAPQHWAPSLFLSLNVPFDALANALEAMFYNQEAPFTGRNRKVVALDLLYVLQRWVEETANGRMGARGLCGGEEYAAGVLGLVEQVAESDVGSGDRDVREMAGQLAMRMKLLLR